MDENEKSAKIRLHITPLHKYPDQCDCVREEK